MEGKQKPHFKIFSERDVMIFLFLDEYLHSESDLNIIFDNFKELIQQLDVMKVVVDFSRVKIISSLVLGKLVELNNYITKQGGKLAVCNSNEEIKETLRITRLDEFMNVLDEREKAIMAISDKGHISRIMPVLCDDELQKFLEASKNNVDNNNNN